MAPAFEIFRVKVLVWRVGPTPREEPTETAPAESEPVKTALSELMQVKPKNSKDWLFDKVEKHKLAKDIPTGSKAATRFSEMLETEMTADFAVRKCLKALSARSNMIPAIRLQALAC